MAALCEEFTLCGLLSETEKRQQGERSGLQGVERAGERDTVLVTDSGRTVTVYKVSDQRPLGSWAVRQGQRISCPAVYNHSSGEFVVVHDDRVVRVWKDSDVSLEKVFKATLSADVSRVLSLPEDEPLVLFRGGALRYLDALLANPQQEIETILTEGEKITWSLALSDGGQPLIIFITEKAPDWFVYTWRPAFSASQRWRVPPAIDGSRLLDYSTVMKNNMASLVLLYSSGHVCHSEVSLAPWDQEGVPELSVSPLLQLPGAVHSGAVMILRDSYIATLTAGATGQKDRLCIWNTGFQTLQDCKEFSRKTCSQLWSYDSRLYIPLVGSLLVLRFTCEPSSLASALGKGKSARGAVTIVNWEAMTGKTEPPSPAAARRTPRAKKTRSSEETSPSLDLLQTVPENQIPSLVQRIWGITELVRFQDAVHTATQRLVTRCKTEPSFYPHSAFTRLIESGMLSYSLCPELLPLCVERQDLRGAQLCLEQFADVPEGVLCSCLKLFLSVDENVVSGAAISAQDSGPAQNGCSSPPARAEDRRAEAQHCPVTQRRADLLNSVLSSPVSEGFLLPHLKDLRSEQVLLLLQYLRYLYQKCSEDVALKLPGEGRLTVTQVLDWMNLILDANFTVLVLLPTAKNLLRTLQKHVRSQVRFFSELYKISGSLSELQTRRSSGQSRGRYSIEVLELY